MFSVCGHSCDQCAGKANSLFRKLDVSELTRVNTQKISYTFQKGESIFHHGDPSEYVFCIEAGTVQLFRSSQSREQSFGIIGTGAAIGYRDALAKIPYQHNARALTRTTVCKVKREDFQAMMERNPVFMAAVVSELAGGWQESEKQSYNLGARKTIERLADFILTLKKDRQTTLEEGIDFPFTRETVATLLGTTTESIIRTFSDFKARGYIDFMNGKLFLKNESALSKLVLES